MRLPGTFSVVETIENISDQTSRTKTRRKRVEPPGQRVVGVQSAEQVRPADWTLKEKTLSEHDVSAEGVKQRLGRAGAKRAGAQKAARATKDGAALAEALHAAEEQHDRTVSQVGATMGDDGQERLVDLTTGEVGAPLIVIAQRSRSGLNGGFVMVSQAMAERLANDGKDLSPNAWRLLMLCLGKCDYETVFDLNVTAIADAWGVSRTTITSARRQLMTAGVIRDAATEVGGHTYKYALDPNFVWKGREGGRRRALRVVGD